MRIPAIALLIPMVALVVWIFPAPVSPPPARDLLGIVYPSQYIVSTAQERYEDKQIKILIVPGHDNQYFGANFGRLKEADLNLILSRYLAEELAVNPNWQVLWARDLETGEYVPALKNYFADEREAISAFRAKAREQFRALLGNGEVERREVVAHNYAAEEVSIRLYGINRWANENDVDLIIHVHFNDYPRPAMRVAGRYSGFAIYVPEGQLQAAPVSQAVARAVFNELEKFFSVSNLPVEKSGIIEAQGLIALGSNNSLERAAILIEYGYIYRASFVDPASRETTLSKMAELTASGLVNFFEGGTGVRYGL